MTKELEANQGPELGRRLIGKPLLLQAGGGESESQSQQLTILANPWVRASVKLTVMKPQVNKVKSNGERHQLLASTWRHAHTCSKGITHTYAKRKKKRKKQGPLRLLSQKYIQAECANDLGALKADRVLSCSYDFSTEVGEGGPQIPAQLGLHTKPYLKTKNKGEGKRQENPKP